MYTERCWDVAKFDVIKVFEIQQQLCALSYFDLVGRAKLSLCVSKGLLAIPLTMLNSAPVNDHEIICAILVRLICFVEGCEKGMDKSLRLVGWRL